MKALALFFCASICCAQAADVTGSLSLMCVKGHLQSDGHVASPDQLLCQFDATPVSSDLLREQLSRLASDPNDPKRHLAVGLAYLNRADTNHWEYLESAKEHLAAAKDAYPKDPFILMYLGRATGAQALNMKPSIYTRLKAARSGFRLMDMAVKLHPDCVFLSLLRGEAQLMAHPILRRGERLKKDANTIANFVKTEEFGRLSSYQQARMHLFLGGYLEKTKAANAEIQDQWQLAYEKAGDTDLGNEARARLQGHWESIGYTEE